MTPTSPADFVDRMLQVPEMPPPASTDPLVEQIVKALKECLRARYAVGERPSAADCVRESPELACGPDCLLSLAYEEFCLREEYGEAPEAGRFCDGYPECRESLAAQIRYHKMIDSLGLDQAPQFPAPGERFAQFRILSVLGRGNFGCAYLAIDEDLGSRPVVLKVGLDRDDEPAIQGPLDHPRIMPVLSVVRDRATGLRGLCMPYKVGAALDVVLKRFRSVDGPGGGPIWDSLVEAIRSHLPNAVPLSPGHGWVGCPLRRSYAEVVAWISRVVAQALCYLHKQGICHRDIKPSNVLLTARDGPILFDFGLASRLVTPRRDAQLGRGGTPLYMAPEQLAAFVESGSWDDVGPAADLYSLGLLMHEMLEGTVPLVPKALGTSDLSIQDLVFLRLHPPPKLYRGEGPAALRQLRRIIGKCLHPDPQRRHATAGELTEDLADCMAASRARHSGRRRPRLHLVRPRITSHKPLAPVIRLGNVGLTA